MTKRKSRKGGDISKARRGNGRRKFESCRREMKVRVLLLMSKNKKRDMSRVVSPTVSGRILDVSPKKKKTPIDVSDLDTSSYAL